jgi:hypothetical protein
MVMWFFVVAIAVTLTTLAIQRGRPTPQLDIKNSGTTPVTIKHRSDSLLLQSGQTGHLRFRPGETLTVHAGDTTAFPSKTITLESRGIQPGSPPRVPVEVRAEGTEVHFTYTADK